MTAIGTFTCTLSVSNYSCECIEHINHSLLLQTYVSSPRTWVHVTATMNSGTTTGPRIRADHSSMVAVKAITTDSMTSGHVKIDASRIFHLHLRRRHLPHPWHLHRRLRGEWILCSSVVFCLNSCTLSLEKYFIWSLLEFCLEVSASYLQLICFSQRSTQSTNWIFVDVQNGYGYFDAGTSMPIQQQTLAPWPGYGFQIQNVFTDIIIMNLWTNESNWYPKIM